MMTRERALQRLMFAVFDSPPRWSGTDWIMLGAVVDEALATLTPREIIVTQMRVGLMPRSTKLRSPIREKYDHTLAEIGLALNISAVRAHQIWSKSLRKLRHPTRSRLFMMYYLL
jgi:RNA polymerase primary sigma factor